LKLFSLLLLQLKPLLPDLEPALATVPSPAPFYAFLNETPNFDAFFLPTRDCYLGESSASVLD